MSFIYGETRWVKSNVYEYEIKTSRLLILKMLFRGTIKLKWNIPVNFHDKRLKIEGKLVK